MVALVADNTRTASDLSTLLARHGEIAAAAAECDDDAAADDLTLELNAVEAQIATADPACAFDARDMADWAELRSRDLGDPTLTAVLGRLCSFLGRKRLCV